MVALFSFLLRLFLYVLFSFSNHHYLWSESVSWKIKSSFSSTLLSVVNQLNWKQFKTTKERNTHKSSENNRNHPLTQGLSIARECVCRGRTEKRKKADVRNFSNSVKYQNQVKQLLLEDLLFFAVFFLVFGGLHHIISLHLGLLGACVSVICAEK